MEREKIRILLVDDDQNLLTSLYDILVFKGYTVLRSTKGKHALDLVKNEPVEVALIDLRLEDMTGLELLQQLKQEYPTTECILLTGYASQRSAIDAIHYGAFGYFQKPFDMDQVILSIEQAGQKSKAAAALAASERRFRKLIENGRDNIILLNEDGKPADASPALGPMWDYPLEEYQQKGVFSLIHPDDKEMAVGKFLKIAKNTGSSENVECRLINLQGKYRWVEGTIANSLEDPAIHAIVFNFRDITEQKEVNDRMKLLGSALQAAANAIVIADHEGTILWVNSAFESLTGYSRKEIIGQNPRILKSGEQNEEFYRQMWNSISSGSVWHSELINKRKDGTNYTEEMTITPLVGTSGKCDFYIAIKQDVTERKNFEKNLALSESRYRSLFEESPVAVIEEDFSGVKAKIEKLRKRGVKDWRRYFKEHPEIVQEMLGLVKVIDVNKSAVFFHGGQDKLEIFEKFETLFPGSTSERFLDELVHFAEGDNNFYFEAVNKTFDGRFVNVIIYVSVTPGYEHDLSKVIVSVVDISSLKRAEESLKEKNLIQEKIVALSRKLAESMDLSVIFQTAESCLKTMIDCPHFQINLFDAERKVMVPAYISINGKMIDPSIISQGEFPSDQEDSGSLEAITSKVPIIIQGLKEKTKGNPHESIYDEEDTASKIYLPMQAEEHVIGVIELRSDKENAYSKETSEWLSVAANLIGLAIQNAKLHENILHELSERKKAEKEIRQTLAELELLYEYALTVNQMLDPAEIGQATIKLITRYYSWYHATIRLRVGNTDKLRLIGYYVPGINNSERLAVERRFNELVSNINDGLTGWVMRSGQPLRVADVTNDPRYLSAYPGIQSGLYVPIRKGQHILGVVAIESDKKDAFSERDERLFTTIANQAAIAFDNASLYNEVQRELAERKATEEELRVSQERLQSIMDNTNACVYMKDLEHRYVMVNAAMSKIYNLQPEQIIGKSPFELELSEEVNEYIEHDCEVLRLQAPLTFEEIRTQNGEKRSFLSFKFPLFNKDGSVSGTGGISSDISDLRKAEEQITLLSYAIDQSPVSVVLTDSNGMIEYVNKRFTENTGYSPEEVIGKTPYDYQNDNSLRDEMHKLFDVIIKGKEWQGEIQNRHKNGQRFWESMLVSPVKEKNKTTHFLEVSEDITARKEAEFALRQLNQELEDRVNQRTAELHAANVSLEKASKLKDEFLASMSHELRTPLTGVLGLSEALQKGVYGPINEKQTNILYTIEEGGRHLLTLINDILDLSKIEAGKSVLQPSIINVDDLCQASLRMVKQIAASKHQRVVFNQDPQNLVMYADPRRLKQILVNLLGNAVKFTPENGELGLDVTGDETTDTVRFVVWDKGIGIAPEDMDRLFQPFVQLDSSLSKSYAGTGLGLSLVQNLTQLHNGTVEVASTPGQGSRFKVTIPWKRENAALLMKFASEKALKMEKIAETQQSTMVPGTVLLVDDNQINSDMLSDLLSYRGYKVVIARDGRQALDLVKKIHPGIILMDIQMAEMDGIEVIRIIRTMPGELAKIPIIALTALAMPEDHQKCLDAGADDYQSKPLNMVELLASIKKYIGKNQ